MQEVCSLDPSVLPINFNDIKVVISDIDHTLLNIDKGFKTADDYLLRNIGQIFFSEYENIKKVLCDYFWSKPNELEKNIEVFKQLGNEFSRLQKQAVPKIWDRTTWFVLISERLSLGLADSEIVELRNKFWSIVKKNSEVYSDACKLAEFLNSRHIPLILMTGSDCICQINGNGNLCYDASYAAQYKLKRLQMLDFKYECLLTGDPDDKPTEAFFNKVWQEVDKSGFIERRTVLAIGDSYRNDLFVPEKAGCRAVLIKRPVNKF